MEFLGMLLVYILSFHSLFNFRFYSIPLLHSCQIYWNISIHYWIKTFSMVSVSYYFMRVLSFARAFYALPSFEVLSNLDGRVEGSDQRMTNDVSAPRAVGPMSNQGLNERVARALHWFRLLAHFYLLVCLSISQVLEFTLGQMKTLSLKAWRIEDVLNRKRNIFHAFTSFLFVLQSFQVDLLMQFSFEFFLGGIMKPDSGVLFKVRRWKMMGTKGNWFGPSFCFLWFWTTRTQR